MRPIAALILAACGTSSPEPSADEAPAAEATSAPTAADHASAVADHASATEVHEATWRTFGAGFTTEEVTPLADVLDTPASFVDQTVRVEGRIADVCQKAGCWLVLADGERTIRVTTKDHDFGVDRDTASMWAELEGTVVARQPDPERTAHLRSESAHPEAMPENHAGDVHYEIEATAIRVRPAS